MIPQYCTAHNNTQKYNGGLPCRKARTREKWAFGKTWLGKRGGNLWQRRKRQLSESVEIIESAKISVLSFSNMAEYSQSRGNLNRCDSLFLLMYTYWCTTYLNQHGDLYFLFLKNILHIILLNLEKKSKELSEGKKDIAESVRKT